MTIPRNLSKLAEGADSNGILQPSNGGTLIWQSVQTSNFTAIVGNNYPVDTTSASVTVTLPSSPSIGQQFALIDYAGTWATNNVIIDVSSSKINGLGGSTYQLYLQTNRQSVNFVYINSTQGWLASINDSNTFAPNPPIPTSVNYLVVAGGGGALVGGGGAGGFRNGTLSIGSSFTVTVGAGGAGGGSSSGNGSNSIFSSITSIGGGGTNSNEAGSSGGSGGGGDSSDHLVSGGAGTAGQGNNGGSNGGYTGSPYTSGGGGGAGYVGQNAPASNLGGNGGDGSSSSISGASVYYAGGGAGCTYIGGGAGTGGVGGGGNANGAGIGTSGTANTGGGGGGGQYRQGGNGGSGIVIISYPSAYGDFTSIGGGLTYTKTISGGNKIYKFTSGTGTITV